MCSCRWATARAQPRIDSTQNIQSVSITRTGGYTSMSFIRRINTGDNSDDISLSSPRFFVYGFNGPVDFTSNSIRQHRNTPVISNNRITLPTSAQCTGRPLIIKLLTEFYYFHFSGDFGISGAGINVISLLLVAIAGLVAIVFQY